MSTLKLRNNSRQLLREWGILKLSHQDITPTRGHAIIAINEGINTISDLSEHLLLDLSTTSRLVANLHKQNLIRMEPNQDKRSKILSLTDSGHTMLKEIDRFSDKLIHQAFSFLSDDEQTKIEEGIALYVNALKKSRLVLKNTTIHTLKKNKKLRQAITNMIYKIQCSHFKGKLDPAINNPIIHAEQHYTYKGKCNFWYATNEENKVVGCIGLKILDEENAELNKCFVDPTYKGRGLAQLLIKKLAKQAIKLDIKHIYLGCVDYFFWAHRFYEKLGFTEINKSQLPKNFIPCNVDKKFYQAQPSIILKHLKQ